MDGDFTNAVSNREAPGLLQLICVECGARLEAAPRWGWQRCPNCGAVGYADRAGQHLLSISWTCPSCSTRNSGLANFCIACGAGLATRCLRCEAPIYTAICPNCGSHQERLLRLQNVEADRAAWQPILQTFVQQSRLPVAARMQVKPIRQPRTWNWPAFRLNKWGVLWIVVGLLLVLWQLRGPLEAVLDSIVQNLETSPGFDQNFEMARVWWEGLRPGLQGLSRDSLEYSYFFASVVFGLAVLPVALYLIHRILQRLFP